MASEAATLSSLEDLLNEFFGGSTNNERKKQIESLLNNFGLQDGAWHQCVYFLNHSTNYYVHMYAFGILENMVNQKWHGVSYDDKQQLRKFLHDFLLSKHKQIPPFIRNKTLKVIVNVGRLDWPMFYPTFFSNIVQLLQNSGTTLLGVIGLQMISEEFISPREDLSMSRRIELKDCLTQHIPNALHLLTEILNSVLQKHKRATLTVTPPPSPNHNSPYHTPYESPYQSPYQSPHHSPAHRNLSANLIHSPLQKQDNLSSLQTLDSETEELCIHVFTCLSQYITWLPLSKIVTPALVTKIFNFAEYGCSAVINGTEKTSSQVGIHAMTCINEILSKKFVPAEYDTFLLLMFQQTFNILQLITKGRSSTLTAPILKVLDESYVEKLTEFLYLFIENHFGRIESNTHFPTNELLSLLLKYTAVQESCDMYLQCLDIWHLFLDFLIDKVSACITSNFKVAALEKYIPCLIELLNEVLVKIQFQHNVSWLNDIDQETLDDDNETDWEKFIKPCLEIVGKISELLPEDSFSKCSQLFQENIDVYFGLAARINSNVLTVGHLSDQDKLHRRLLDLSTMFRFMGRLSSLFTDEVNFKSRFDQAKVLLERLIQGAMFGGFYKTYTLKVEKSELLNDLLEINCQALGAVHAFSHWLLKFQLSLPGESNDQFNSMIVSVLDVIMPLITPQIPVKISIAASHLLVSVTTTVRPSIFLKLPQAQKLYQQCDNAFRESPKDVQKLVFRGLSNALVLPWPNIPSNNQEWEERSVNHERFISSICKDLNNIPDVNTLIANRSSDRNWNSILVSSCDILSDIVESISNEKTTSRKIVYNSIKSIISICSKILPAYITDSDVANAILCFILASIKGLKVQMGTSSVEEIISRLLSLLTREQMIEILKSGNSSGINALDRFISLLQLLVQEPDPNFKKLLPNILSYGLDHLLPVLKEFNVPDLLSNVLEMFHQALLNSWRYFFKSNIISKMNGEDQIRHGDQFAAILKEFGEPLLGNQISLFKKSIEILQSLNDKFHLYEKIIFQSTMLISFLQVLLNSLIQKSHALLQDEIISAVYSMVSSNFDVFFNQFIPHFLMNTKGLTDRQRSQLHDNYNRHQDIPSFSTSLEQFIGDLRYMQLLNNSLPPGTVQL